MNSPEKLSCKICGTDSFLSFKNILLFKYEVSFYQCHSCGYIQSEEPFWLEEAYKDQAVSVYDINIIERNIFWRERVASLIDSAFRKDGKFIDYGGGTGIFVRLMRNLGYDYYLFDSYSKNLFAREFYVEIPTFSGKAELLTAFEVFEHLVDPVDEVKKMFSLSDTILFSTTLQPDYQVTKDNWKYLAPETGQHISLYTLDSLNALAKRFDATLISNGTNAHILSRKKLKLESSTLDAIVSGKEGLPVSFLNRLLYKLGLSIKRVKKRKSLSENDQRYIIETMSHRAGAGSLKSNH